MSWIAPIAAAILPSLLSDGGQGAAAPQQQKQQKPLMPFPNWASALGTPAPQPPSFGSAFLNNPLQNILGG